MSSVRSASSAANCSGEMFFCASWPRDNSSEPNSVSSPSTARLAAAAGLLISCAMPAANVPRVTRELRCLAVDSMERAVR